MSLRGDPTGVDVAIWSPFCPAPDRTRSLPIAPPRYPSHPIAPKKKKKKNEEEQEEEGEKEKKRPRAQLDEHDEAIVL